MHEADVSTPGFSSFGTPPPTRPWDGSNGTSEWTRRSSTHRRGWGTLRTAYSLAREPATSFCGSPFGRLMTAKAPLGGAVLQIRAFAATV